MIEYKLLKIIYSKEQCKRVIEAGLKGYEAFLRKCLNGNAKMHRSAAEGAASRRVKKLLGKSNWFKKKKKIEGKKKNKTQKENSPEVVTVLFVPQTPQGELARRLKVVENKISKLSGEKVKIVERGGTQVKQIMHKSNPWNKGFCGRANCLTCLHGDGSQNCFDKNVVYQISCQDCEEGEQKKSAIYIGQTSRSLHERGKEHLLGLRQKQEKNPLFKHVSEVHDGDTKMKFEMKTVKKHFSAFSRLIHESVLIERTSKAGNLTILNSKGEWGRSHLPRLKLDNSMNESNVDLVINNVFSKEEEEWNVSERRGGKDKVKRKASSEKIADDDEPKSNNKKTFSFTHNDIKNSTKAAIISNAVPKPNFKRQTDIYRFLAADPDFSVRKKKRNI